MFGFEPICTSHHDICSIMPNWLSSNEGQDFLEDRIWFSLIRERRNFIFLLVTELISWMEEGSRPYWLPESH